MSLELHGCWADALCVCLCEMLYGALMKGDMMQRWQWAISLCRGWFICVSVECDRDGKKMSQWHDVNHRQGGGLFSESQLCPSIFLFSPLFIPLFHVLLIPVIPPECWWGCKWGSGGRLGLPSYLFLSTCLSVRLFYLLLSIFLLRIWILVEDGCVLSTSHGLRLNPKCPLREPVRWEEGMECR